MPCSYKKIKHSGGKEKKGNHKAGGFWLVSLSFWKIKSASPTYLSSDAVSTFDSAGSVWIYLHVGDCDIPEKNNTLKQIRLWESEIFHQSNAGLMPEPRDRSKNTGFFHYLWRRSTFGCLPASPGAPRGGLVIRGVKTVQWRSLLTRW